MADLAERPWAFTVQTSLPKRQLVPGLHQASGLCSCRLEKPIEPGPTCSILPQGSPGKWSGLPSPLSVNHSFLELFTMTCPSLVALFTVWLLASLSYTSLFTMARLWPMNNNNNVNNNNNYFPGCTKETVQPFHFTFME